MKKCSYRWRCLHCGEINDPHIENCAFCGFPATASANDVARFAKGVPLLPKSKKRLPGLIRALRGWWLASFVILIVWGFFLFVLMNTRLEMGGGSAASLPGINFPEWLQIASLLLAPLLAYVLMGVVLMATYKTIRERWRSDSGAPGASRRWWKISFIILLILILYPIVFSNLWWDLGNRSSGAGRPYMIEILLIALTLLHAMLPKVLVVTVIVGIYKMVSERMRSSRISQ